MKNQIKYLQYLFYELLNDYGQVYLVIKHSENTHVGTRGFLEEEKKKGLVLIFNQKNHKNLHWAEDGSITATLGFGSSNKPEKCFLHFDDIVAVFSPYAKIRFDRWDMWDESVEAKPDETQPAGNVRNEKVVSLDRFRKKKA